MSRASKAVIYRELNKPLTIEEVFVDSPQRGEVMVKISACGVCHSDVSVTNGTIPLPPPLILGHEAAGVVVEIGEGVDDIMVGDHVVASWSANCGKCNYCRVGKGQLCDMTERSQISLRDGRSPVKDNNGQPVGVFLGGVMSQYATLHRDSVVKIDKTVPLETAALIGCAIMTGVGAVINTARIEVGSTVAIFGAGGIGLSAIQGAVMSSALKIIAVDVSDEHLQFAKKFGATHLINPMKDGDPVGKIQEITNGGVDYAFECIGLPLTISQAYDCVHKGGIAVIVGISKMTDAVTIPSFMIPISEKILKGSNYGSASPTVDFPKLLGLYQRGILKLDEMITTRYTIEEANTAFDDLVAGKNVRGLIVF